MRNSHFLCLLAVLFFIVHTHARDGSTYNDYNPLFMFTINNPSAAGTAGPMNVHLPSGDTSTWMKYFLVQNVTGYFRQDCHPALIFVNVDGLDKSYLYFDDSRKQAMDSMKKFRDEYNFWMSFMSFKIDNIESIKEQMNVTIYSKRCPNSPHQEIHFSGKNAITEFKTQFETIFMPPSSTTDTKITTAYLDIQIDQFKDLLDSMWGNEKIKSDSHYVLVFIFSTHSNTIKAQDDEDIWEADSDSHFFDLYSIASPSIWMILMGVIILFSLIVFAIIWISRIQIPYHGFKRD